jgi:hypothetical protein
MDITTMAGIIVTTIIIVGGTSAIATAAGGDKQLVQDGVGFGRRPF